MNQPIPPDQLRALIKTTLTPFGLYSDDVCELLMFTFANESHCGMYRHQINGPALGIGQMEPFTHDDIWANYLKYHPILTKEISDKFGGFLTSALLETSDPYSIIFARLQYLRYPDKIPPGNDLDAIWLLYKKRYNSNSGAANKQQAMDCYNKYAKENPPNVLP